MDYWSECGQIYFCGGLGFGLTKSLATICLGKEDDITQFFETQQFTDDINEQAREVLNQILEYRRENGTTTRGTSVERASLTRFARHRKKDIRPSAHRKRLPR